MSPGDYQIIYDVKPVYPPTGLATVAVVGRSNINASDVTSFTQYLMGVARTPEIVVNGPDPGDLGRGEEAEAVLDTSWATAASVGGDYAYVQLVVSKTTNTTDGIDLSEEYIVDRNYADVMTESFGACEAYYTQAQATFYSSLAEQAAVQGITYVVAAGDSGSSGCDTGSDAQSDGLLSVNILASNPYVTAVGGTEFNEGSNSSSYWSSTNSTTGVSVLSYIPENAWNESCTGSTGVNPCPSGYSQGLWAGGGGASSVYSKPYWQAGVPGIPNDGARDIPDISLTAAGHDPYLICLNGSCQPNNLGEISFYGYAGTSAATPSFAGFVALAVIANRRLGLLNPILYQLAASESLSGCNASNTSSLPNSSCVFNDVTVGNNSDPGQPGYNTATGTYQAGTGYDLATGLGSVNEANLETAIHMALGSGTPGVTASASSLQFGSVVIGSSKTLQVTFFNSGTSWLRIEPSETSEGPFSISECAWQIPPGQSCSMSFVFTPGLTGPSLGYVTWTASTQFSFVSEGTVTLTGTGVATVTLTPSSSLNFGNQKVVTRSTQSITITNSTSQYINMSGIALSGSNISDFSTINNCGGGLAPGEIVLFM